MLHNDVSIEDAPEYKPSAWAIQAAKRLGTFKWVNLGETAKDVIWRTTMLARVIDTSLPAAAFRVILKPSDDLKVISGCEYRYVMDAVHTARKIAKGAKVRRLMLFQRRIRRVRKTFKQYVLNTNHKTMALIIAEIKDKILAICRKTFKHLYEVADAIDGVLGYYILNGYIRG